MMLLLAFLAGVYMTSCKDKDDPENADITGTWKYVTYEAVKMEDGKVVKTDVTPVEYYGYLILDVNGRCCVGDEDQEDWGTYTRTGNQLRLEGWRLDLEGETDFTIESLTSKTMTLKMGISEESEENKDGWVYKLSFVKEK